MPTDTEMKCARDREKLKNSDVGKITIFGWLNPGFDDAEPDPRPAEYAIELVDGEERRILTDALQTVIKRREDREKQAEQDRIVRDWIRSVADQEDALSGRLSLKGSDWYLLWVGFVLSRNRHDLANEEAYAAWGRSYLRIVSGKGDDSQNG